MKKFLSLVLALAMTMSLVTVSAGAKDFTDDSEINYKEAVDVMSALGVVDGYSDGDFNPQDTLTRGAAAKIICNLILGPTTAAALHADTAPLQGRAHHQHLRRLHRLLLQKRASSPAMLTAPSVPPAP